MREREWRQGDGILSNIKVDKRQRNRKEEGERGEKWSHRNRQKIMRERVGGCDQGGRIGVN